jgi:YD repeat-containing protein
VAGRTAQRFRARLFAGLAIGALAAGEAAAQVSTQYYYDALGRLVAAADSNGKAVGYTYDMAGNRTQVTNSVPFDEIIPVGFTSSFSEAGDGLTTPMGMRDGAFAPIATAHGTSAAANGFITANFGAQKALDHVDIAPTNVLPWAVANANGVLVQWSTDNATWTTVATTAGATLNQYMSIPMGGVKAQYVRLFQPAATRMAVGDFRFYGRNTLANPPPQAGSFPITLLPTGGLIDLTGHIFDAEGLPLTVTAFNNSTVAQSGMVSQASNTSFNYTPNAGYLGPDSFNYTITDGTNGTATGVISVTVALPANHNPVANSETIGTPPGVAITFNPLTNDTDADGDTLTITSVSGTHGGQTTSTPTTITYSPLYGFAGDDNLTYTISDGHGGTASATDTIHVAFGAGPDHAPVTGNDFPTTPENTTLSNFPVLANDTDEDGDTLTISGVSVPTLGGTATIDPSRTTITYVPPHNVTGIDTFTYTVSDGRDFTAVQGTVEVVIQPVVSPPPVAMADSATTLAETQVMIPVLNNDQDPAGGGLLVIGVTQTPHAAIGFTNNSVSYLPNYGFIGTDTFQYTVKDINGLRSSANVTVSVGNNPPFGGFFSISTAFGTATTFDPRVSPVDSDGQAVSVTSVATPVHGTATVNGPSSVTYTPKPGWQGSETFNFTVEDTLGAPGPGTITVTTNPPGGLAVIPSATTWSGGRTLNQPGFFDPAITVSVTGGTAPYTYQWVNQTGNSMTAVNQGGASTTFYWAPAQVGDHTAVFICVVTDATGQVMGQTGAINVDYDYENGS